MTKWMGWVGLLALLLCRDARAQVMFACGQNTNVACANGAQTSSQTITTIHNYAGAATMLTLDGATADANKISITLTGDPASSFTVSIPHTAASATSQAITCGAGQHVSAHSATTGAFTCSADTGGTNALLDASAHTDTTASAVTRGDIIFGNSTPAWDDLAIGSANTFLHSNGTDPAWAAIAAADIGPGDLANALTWDQFCTASPCTLSAAPRGADTAEVIWRTLVQRRVAACGGINEYTLSGTTLTLCDATGIGSGADSVRVIYEL